MSRSWRVDLGARSVTQAEAGASGTDGDAWGVIGDVRDWEEVLTGRLGLATAVRSGRVRISAPAAGGLSPLLHDPRVAVLGDFLTTAEQPESGL
jgi:hypothetical protein